jgi:hypothetical protein
LAVSHIITMPASHAAAGFAALLVHDVPVLPG